MNLSNQLSLNDTNDLDIPSAPRRLLCTVYDLISYNNLSKNIDYTSYCDDSLIEFRFVKYHKGIIESQLVLTYDKYYKRITLVSDTDDYTLDLIDNESSYRTITSMINDFYSGN